jgi:adenine-specific DNA-methyltransferase
VNVVRPAAPGVINGRAAVLGEVFTRPWVAELILDLVGYLPERDLARYRLVEPSCGPGAFLEVIARRVSDSCRLHDRPLVSTKGAVRAFDVLALNTRIARQRVVSVFVDNGWAIDQARAVAQAWVRTGDYLLAGLAPGFERDGVDFVVGNPPYLRLEDVPARSSRAYRAAWPTMAGRADIFIGFFERGLRSLKPAGTLGFICADRWMRNQYGADLRELVSRNFSVDVVINMHQVDVFQSDVSAYPAITVLSARPQRSTLVIDTTGAFGPEQVPAVVDIAGGGPAPADHGSFTAARLPRWFEGASSWPQGSASRLEMIRRLTAGFPPLQDVRTGTRVGIGVATGVDRVFVVPTPIDVEADRLLPLSMVADVASGSLNWSGHYLVSPWAADGLVDLEQYPQLGRSYRAHAEAIRRRHVAGRYPRQWYRTIDRVNLELTGRPKLLLPDLRRSIHPVLDEGGTYPHHNLYYVVSEAWDLRVLGGLLLSEVANAFVEAYAVRMRGGTLRFQAQYLRRIRVPERAAISSGDAAALADAFDRRDVEAATTAALRCYGLAELPG